MNYQALASQGRYGDTTLVHMTPREVSGLNALGAAYGRPMTINPQTGYPEAFNLKNLLPMIIGTGLNIASGGALTPLQIGMMTGAGYAVATGDPMQGLSAGIGAAGGAGIGSGLTASGSAAMPVQGVGTMGENFARAGQGIKALGTGPGVDAFMGQAATSATPATGIGGFGGLAKSAAMSLAPEVADVGTNKLQEDPTYIQPYSLNISNLSGMPSVGSSERPQITYGFEKEEPYRLQEGGPVSDAPAMSDSAARVFQNIANIRGLAGGQAPMMGNSTAQVLQNIANVQRAAGIGAIDVPTMSPSVSAAIATPMAPVMSSREIDYGIPMPVASDSPVFRDIEGQARLRRLEEQNQTLDYGAAQGGLANLREGRFLRGDGDGMSDEIPASIEGEVDALLSDGEFVIPADVVSHLGNGSSAAGAKVLYDLMGRIRKERTGQTEQAEEVEIEKILPA